MSLQHRPFQASPIAPRVPRMGPSVRSGVTCASALLSSRRILRQWNKILQFQNISTQGDSEGQASKMFLGKSLRLTPQKAPGDGQGRPGAGAARKAALVWFRGDLRLHDHEALSRANSECTSILPVYCFDPRDYQKSPQGYDRTGPYRAQFLVEAVEDLRQRLRRAGSELVVRWGRPEEVLAGLVRRMGAAAVYCHGEVTFEGKQTEGRVKAAVEGEGAQLSVFWSNTLHHLQDLPFCIQDLPQNFDQFRERTARVAARAALQAPSQLRGLPLGVRVDPGEVPTLKQLGLTPPPQSSQDSKPVGGETEALRQLRNFFTHASQGAGGSSAAATKGSSGGGGGVKAACGSTFANNIAPWLAAGCLSPRHMHAEAQRALGGAAAAPQSVRNGGDPLAWVNFELLWRDFFRFMTLRYTSMSAAKVGAASKAGAAALPA